MGAADSSSGRGASLVIVSLFVILLALTAALAVLSIPAGTYAFFSGKLSTVYGSTTLVHPYLWIGPSVLSVPFAVEAGALFLILTAVYIVFLVYGVRQGVTPWKAVALSAREGVGALMSSPFIVMMTSMAFLIFTASEIDVAISGVGVPIGNLSGDPLILLLGFTASPLVEELGFRVVLIGIVALILSVGRPRKEALGSLWRPSMAMEGLAVGSGASVIIWAAMALSGVTFGACHVICGSSTWDIGKFPEATFGGLVLGYLYVRYGLHVAVIAHWGVDFFGSAFAFFGQAVYGIPWNSATNEYYGQNLVDKDMLYLFGLASFLVVVYLGLMKYASKKQTVATEGLARAQQLGGERRK